MCQRVLIGPWWWYCRPAYASNYKYPDLFVFSSLNNYCINTQNDERTGFESWLSGGQTTTLPLYHPVILSFYSFWKMDVRKRHTRQPKSGARGDADSVNPLTFCKPCVAEDHKINLIGQTTLKCWRVQFETNKFLHSMRWSLQMGMWSSSPPPFRIPLIHHSEKNCSD